MEFLLNFINSRLVGMHFLKTFSSQFTEQKKKKKRNPNIKNNALRHGLNFTIKNCLKIFYLVSNADI